VPTRSKAWVDSRSLAGIAGSNLAGDIDVCVVRWRSVRRADHQPRGVLPSAVRLVVNVKPRRRGGPDPLGAVAPWEVGGGSEYLLSG